MRISHSGNSICKDFELNARNTFIRVLCDRMFKEDDKGKSCEVASNETDEPSKDPTGAMK